MAKKHKKGSKWCVMAGKTKKKCYHSKAKAKKVARGRRKRGLKARVVRRSKR